MGVIVLKRREKCCDRIQCGRPLPMGKFCIFLLSKFGVTSNTLTLTRWSTDLHCSKPTGCAHFSVPSIIQQHSMLDNSAGTAELHESILSELHETILSWDKHSQHACPALLTPEAHSCQNNGVWQMSVWLMSISQTKSSVSVFHSPELATYSPNPGLNLLPGTPWLSTA